VSAIVTVFYKVSIHSLALWGGVGILLPLNKAADNGALLWPTMGIIVSAGLVMSSRLQLNAHVPREILVGSLLGFALGFSGMVILF
jgi:membrane-associated phospholipid phosphatase